MLITPRPGASRDNILKALQEAHVAADNLLGAGPHTAYERLLNYLDWSTQAVRSLRHQISSADIDRLVLTPRHAALLAGVGYLDGKEQQRLVNGLIDLELTDCIAALANAAKALQDTITSWSQPGVFVVADSSFYIQHPEKLEDLDFAPLASAFRGEAIHLLVPIVVVDELDGLKQSGKARARWRAGYTLAVLDRILDDRTGFGRLRDEDFSALATGGLPRGGITVELLLDPPGHARLPIPDDEIVDRAVAAQALAGREIVLVTYDTGQSTRCRIAGLNVVKLRDEAGTGDEPPRT